MLSELFDGVPVVIFIRDRQKWWFFYMILMKDDVGPILFQDLFTYAMDMICWTAYDDMVLKHFIVKFSMYS